MIKAQNFSSREELEKYITTNQPNDVISGTRNELKRLHLSDLTTIYGLKCVITDTPTIIKPQTDKPERGKIYQSKIN